MEVIALFTALGLFAGPRVIRNLRQVALNRNTVGSFDSVRAKNYMGPFNSPMTLREATLILGVRETAGKDKILAAHKRLMLLNHPDNGGSTYIATKVNQAKEIIMERVS